VGPTEGIGEGFLLGRRLGAPESSNVGDPDGSGEEAAEGK